MRRPGSPLRTLVSAAAVAALLLVSFVAARAAETAVAARPTLPFHLSDQFPIGGDGAWGGLDFDPQTRHLFLVRAARVQIVDADSHKLLGEIPCPDGPHALVLAPDKRRGFLASSADTSLLVFDLDKGEAVRTVPLGAVGVGPLVYDAAAQRVFVLDPGGNVSAVDAGSLEIVATRNVGAHPQAAVPDGAGALYVALPDLDAVLVLDAHTLLERARWPLESGAGPQAVAFDPHERRLFVAGKGLYLAVLETDRGRVVTRLPIGGGSEGIVFDPVRHVMATIGRGGSSTTVWQEAADRYTVIATVGTSAGARALALDPAKHVLYTASGKLARYGKAAPGERPPITLVPGSFTLFVLEL